MSQHFGTALTGKAQTAVYGAAAVAVAGALSVGCNRVRVLCTSDAYVTTDGSVPAVGTNGAYVPANVPEYFTVHEKSKPSAIQVATGGTMHVMECN